MAWQSMAGLHTSTQIRFNIDDIADQLVQDGYCRVLLREKSMGKQQIEAHVKYVLKELAFQVAHSPIPLYLLPML